MSDKTEAMRLAREQRSLEKRRSVQDAIETLRSRNEVITFKTVAALAGVSRQFLYDNFKDELSELRNDDRDQKHKIDGKVVPARTPEEWKHVEALLRNKIERLKKELGDVRRENARLKTEAENERGKAEHFRQNWINARSKS